MDPIALSLLSHLWLHEPDDAAVARAHALFDLPLAGAAELAAAYANLFLLNVYPYGTAYTDAWGEVNTPDARRVLARFDAHGYHPKELLETGAPDHLGLCLGFLAYLLSFDSDDAALEARDFVSALRGWAPICCLAVEREPDAHPFYIAMAQRTRETLFPVQGNGGDRGNKGRLGEIGASVLKIETQHAARNTQQGSDISGSEDELRLHDVVRTLLIPSRCGMFLSRGRLGRLANALGLRLPFGSRFEVGEWLFTSAGQSGQVMPLLVALDAEAEAWMAAYQEWSRHLVQWQSESESWIARIAQIRARLALMKQQTQRGVDVWYALSND